MGLSHYAIGLLAATSVAATAGDYVNNNCPLLGPDFPKPSGLANSAPVKTAITAFPSVLKNGTYGKIDTSTTSFSASIFSVSDNKTFFTMYNTADSVKNATTGVKKVDGNSVYRLGSLSKLLTTYALLMEIGDTHWMDPITKYVPELSDAATNYSSSTAIDQVSWEDVTLGELATHLAGVPRDATLGDLSVNLPAGFGPKVPASMMPTCGATQKQAPCSRSDFFKYALQHHPSYPTSGTTPAYSNMAFVLLAYGLEAMCDSTMEAIMEKLFAKAGMHSAQYSESNPSTGVIPFGNQSQVWWNVPTGNEAPAGGYFASNNDVVNVGLSMLQSSILPPAMTRRWLKPQALVSDLTKAMGAPWEIRRIEDSNNRVTDYYTKEGELGAYSSLLVLSPDHGIGIAVNTVDDAPTDPSVLHTITNALVGTFMPAVEQAARQQAAAKFSGNYTDAATQSSVQISTDSKIGLHLQSLKLGGKDVLAELASLRGLTTPPTVRLYPTGLTATSKTSDGKGTYESRVGWKATYEYLPLTNPQKGQFSENCINWFVVDSNNYGLVGLDEVQFGMTESGDVEYVQVRALQVAMKKT